MSEWKGVLVVQNRMFERFQAEGLGLECQLCGHDGALLHDISIGGAGISMDIPVEIGSECQLKVMTGEGRYVLWGSVIWQRNDEEPGRTDRPFKVGIRFDKAVAEASKDLVFNILSTG